MQPVEWAALAAGVALVTGTLASVLHTLVLPRKPRGLAARAPAAVWASHLAASRRLGRYADKDRMLALAGPASLLALLLIWLITLLLGYALILWPLGRQTYGAAVVHAGSALFTLGLSSAGRPLATAVGFAAAATGLGIVALEIAYLPTLYSAYSRREALVTLLESRAGSPAWGVELLARHQLAGILDRLPSLYDEWERWAADVAESHTTYPVLAYFRSPRPLDSWITAELAVLDSAALYLAVCPSEAPSESRLCLRMGFTCLRDIADALGIGYDPDPSADGPIALSYGDFASAVGELVRARLPGRAVSGCCLAAVPRLAGELRGDHHRAGDFAAGSPGTVDRPGSLRKHQPAAAGGPQAGAGRPAWSAAPLLASAARRAQARRTCAARRPQPVGRRAPAVQAGQGHHRRWSGGQRLVHPGPQDRSRDRGNPVLALAVRARDQRIRHRSGRLGYRVLVANCQFCLPRAGSVLYP